MSEIQGHARKMLAENDGPVAYTMRLDDARVPMNELIGKRVALSFTGNIHCQNCGRKTKKSYSQGYCFPCSQRLAACDMCIVRPHTCHFDAGTCREPDWGLKHCFQDHFVYVSNTSGLKVGITRQDQLPTRWIDQGATQALPIFRTRSRHVAGMLEKAIGAHVSDRTDWRRMLKGDADDRELCAERDRLLGLAADDIASVREQFAGRFDGEAPFVALQDDTVSLRYPVSAWPEKVKAHNLDKQPQVDATLVGIKGQYLIFDDGVLNVRKYTAYELALSTSE